MARRLARNPSPFHVRRSTVAYPSSVADVLALFEWAGNSGRHLLFQGGQSSLSGQAVGEGVAVDLERGFKKITVLDDGARVRAEAGATLADVNARLLRHGRRLGPELASARVATIGGLIATNASGPCALPGQRIWDTLESLVVALPTGTVVDTARSGADIDLRLSDPRLVEGLITLRQRLQRPETRDEVRRQFALPNAMGYRIDALLDFRSPVQMVRHLVVGSEGTLAFVAEAVLKTVPLRPRSRRRSLYGPYLELASRHAGHLLLEDFAVPVEAQPEVVAALQDALTAHEFRPMGLVSDVDGTIRYALNVDLDDAAVLRRFRRYRRAVVEVVRDADGSLRASHGTGRAMAPFLIDQFGDELYEVMREVKHTFDPQSLLGPGIVLTDDPYTHTHNLRPGRRRRSPRARHKAR